MAPIVARTISETARVPVQIKIQFLRQVIDRLVLQDLRSLLNPGQAPAPLVGAAMLGTLLSFIPVPFLDTFLVGFIFARFRNVNRAALLAARVLWNDLIVIPLYLPGFRFGMSLLEPHFADSLGLPVQAGAFLLGLFALTLLATCISAVVMFSFITLLQYRHGSVANGMIADSIYSTQGRAHGASVTAGDLQRQGA
jgi:hypothetical protein